MHTTEIIITNEIIDITEENYCETPSLMCGRGRSTYSVAAVRRLVGGTPKRSPHRTSPTRKNPKESIISRPVNRGESKSGQDDIYVTSSISSQTKGMADCHNDSLNELTVEEMIDFSPVENLSPGTEIPVAYTLVQDKCPRRYISLMKWGLIPSINPVLSHNVDHFKMFNARIETVHEKPSFKNLIFRNRCVVLFNGFYEWMGVPGRKTPYYISLEEDEPMIFPGIYDVTASGLVSFTILTCDSCESLRKIHDRQPVILTRSEVEDWLNVNADPYALLKNLKLKKYDDLKLVMYEVSKQMTDPKYQGSDCSQPMKVVESTAKQMFFQSKKIERVEKSIIALKELENDEINCPLCGASLNQFDLSFRESHVNNCLTSCNHRSTTEDIQCNQSILGKRRREEQG